MTPFFRTPGRDPRSTFPVKSALRLAGCFLLLLFFMVGAARADLNVWKPYPEGAGGSGGPWGGSVRRLVTLTQQNPEEIWAATGGGVYRSTDGGASWHARNNGLSSLDISDLSICRNKPWIMAATTAKSGVYRTDDFGENWRRLPDPVVLNRPQTWLGSVAIDPGDSAHLILATYDDANPNYVFESKDGGETWGTATAQYKLQRTVTRVLFTTDTRRDLIITGINGDVIKCARDLSGNLIFSPLLILNKLAPFYEPNSSKKGPVLDICLPDSSADKIAVAAGRAGIRVTSDGGTTWKSFTVVDGYGQGITATSVGFDPVAPSRLLMSFFDTDQALYTGQYETLDFLATAPVKITMPEEGLRIGATLVTGQKDLLGEVTAGLYQRPRGEGQFTFSSQGMTAFQITDFHFSPGGSGATEGLHPLAVSGGTSRQPSGNSGINLWDPQSANWTRRSGRGSKTGATRLIKYQTDTTLWTSVEGFTLYKSLDTGGNWATVGILEDDPSTNTVYSLHFGPQPGDALMSGMGAVRHTNNGGATWSYEVGLKPVSYLLDRDGNGQGYYAASLVSDLNAGVYHTPGFGQNWTRTDGNYFNNKMIASFAASQRVEGHLYAGTAYFGLHESHNGGLNWTPVYTGGLPINGRISNIAIGNMDNDQLAAVHRLDDGIYITGDSGKTWVRTSAGLELGDLSVPEIYALHFAPDGKSLIAAVEGMGLSYLELGGPPTLDNQGSHNVYANRELTIKLLGSDPDGQPITFALIDPPAGATLTGDTFSWTPTPSQAGEHWLTFTVTDGLFTNDYSFLVSVKPPNRPPVLTPIPDLAVNIGATLNHTVSATDADGQALTYSADPMPAGAGFTGASFHWTPLGFQSGVHQINFIAFDGVEYASTTAKIIVNTPPVLQAVGDGAGFIQAVLNSPLTINLDASDPDAGDSLTYFANDQALAAAAYTVTPATADPINVTFKVRDARGAYGNSVSVTINVDPDPGSILAPAFTHVPPQIVNVGDTLNLTISATQPNGLPFTIGSTTLPEGATFTALTGHFQWTAQSDVGQTVAAFNATVNDFPEKSSHLTVDITTNAAPTIDPVGEIIGLVGANPPTRVKITGHDPVDSLTYFAEGLPPWADIDSSTGWITWDAHQLSQRVFVSKIYALDARGNKSSIDVTFRSNNAPSLAPVDEKIVTVGKQVSFNVLAQDIDGDHLTLTVAGLPLGATFNATTGAFGWTPSNTTGSPHQLTFTARDAYGAQTAVSTSIRVNPVPAPPSSGGGGGSGGGCFLTTLGGR